ncbi:Mss4-like protein [Tricharina praecox]|uniref:Mss4-like protein n=1 Tax=Tricharina praecox TaxID=43433 RepID=UPI00221F251C|nr:Mss4-like protein [Tricharina praecox]KAI5856373.1 Mss4-like protein [Tricharina praecox]
MPPLHLLCHCRNVSLNLVTDDNGYTLDHPAYTFLTTYCDAGGAELLFCGYCGARLARHEGGGRVSPLIGCIDIPKDAASAAVLGGTTIRWEHGMKPEPLSAGEGDDPQEEALKGRCLCGAVTFSVLRPPENYKDDAVLKDWIKPGRKFATTLCFCRTCRTTTGAPYWNWTFVPRSLIDIPAASLEALRTYESSAKVERLFCGKCGEMCFYKHSVAGGGVMWDVAKDTLRVEGNEKEWFVGVDDGVEETRVDKYIEGWQEGKCSFEEEGWAFLEKATVEHVAQGWREKWSSDN